MILSRSTFASIEAKAGFAPIAALAVLLIGTVAADAVFRQHAPDVAIEVDRLRHRQSAMRDPGKPKKKG